MLLFAETTGQALDVLQKSYELSENTFESWKSIWEQTVFNSDSSPLWIALVTLGLTLATISIVYLALTEGKNAFDQQDWSQLIAIFVWPLVVAIFLGNNGFLLSKSVQFVRAIGLDTLQQVQEIQISGFTAQKALNQITISNAAREQIEALVASCDGKQNQALVDCLNANRPAIEKILLQAEAQNGGPLNSLLNFAQGIFNAIDNPVDAIQNLPGFTFRNIAFPLLRLILGAIQWAMVNILEASLLLTAIFAPVAMGLSLLPLQGRPIFAWLTGFISILGVQLGYNILVGLAAVVIVNSNGELATDVAFLFFLAVFAPILSILISAGGGIALYRGISSNVKSLLNLATIGVAKLI